MRDLEERLRYYEHLSRKAEKNASDKPMSCGNRTVLKKYFGAVLCL